MKDNIRKGPILYKGMVRGRRKFLIINLIITALYIMYMVRAMPFIVGKFHGPYELDVDKFVSSTQNVTISEEIEMKKRADKSIPGYALFKTSYNDDNKYRFNVKFDDFEDIGVKYVADIEDPMSGEVMQYVDKTVYMGRIGDTLIPVMCSGDLRPDNDNELAGIFVKPAEVIMADISKLTADGTEITINEYIFDARNIEMEVENTDVAVMYIGIALLAFLYIRLIRYYINPYKHPTYKQLLKYGELHEIIDDVENQFETQEVYMDGKELITVDWIMVKETFHNKITKNHRTRGRYS